MTNTEFVTSSPLCGRTLDDLEWQNGDASLSFRVGELTLFSTNVRAAMCRDYWLHIAIQTDPAAPIEIMRRLGVDWARIVSCPVRNRLPRLSIVGGWIRCVTWQYQHQIVQIQPSFGEYEQSFGGKTRSTLRRKVKRFAAASEGTEYFKAYESASEMDAFLTQALAISAKSYQERLLDQGLPRDARYRDELIQRASDKRVVGFLLFHQGKAVAYTVGDIVADGVIFYGFTGYDPAVSELSPGTVLQYLVLDYLHRTQRAEVYDLCVGQANHKRLFANNERDCADILFAKPSLGNILLLCTHLTMEILNEWAATMFSALKLKNVIKRVIRRGARGRKSPQAADEHEVTE